MPEVWTNFYNMGFENVPNWTENIFPALFITIACGAISGFHATQSPLMARCLKSEKMGRPIFYGSMITEGVVALIWATVASWSIMAAQYGLPLLLRPLVASATTKLLKNLKIFSIPVRLQCRIGIFSCHLSQNHTKYPRNLFFSVTMCTFANIKQIRL